MALKGWSDRPVLGWGQEGFNYVFNANYDPAMWAHEQWFDRAHNVYLDWLVAGGAVGLLSYLALYFFLFRAIWKSDLNIKEKSVLIGLVAGYTVHNVFVFDNLISYMSFFALLAFAGSYIQKAHPHSGFVIGGHKSVSSDVMNFVVTPIVVLICLIALYMLNIRVIGVNRTLTQALTACSSYPDAALFEKVMDSNLTVANQEAREQLVICSGPVLNSTNVSTDIKQDFKKIIERATDDQIKFAPKDARSYILSGQFWSSVGDRDRSRDLLEKALLLTPGKPSVKVSLGAIYLDIGYKSKDTPLTQKGLDLLKSAYETTIGNPVTRNAYGVALVVVGQEKLAHELFGNEPEIFESDSLAGMHIAFSQYEKALAVYRKLVAKDPTNADKRYVMAKLQYVLGQKSQAIITLQALMKDHPDLKYQIEADIKDISK